MRVINLVPLVLLAGFSFYLLIVGKDLIEPFVVAVVFWFLISTLTEVYDRFGNRGHRLPKWVALVLAIATFIGMFALFVDLVSANITQVVEAAPVYQANLERLMADTAATLGLGSVPTFGELGQLLDLGVVTREIASGLAELAGYVGIILVYVVFLLIEQRSFNSKLTAILGRDSPRLERVKRVLGRINSDIRTYIWVKTLLSILTGAISYVVMISVGLDLAEFWALLIFLLNYIPTFGSILGAAFPALLTLAQFENPLVPFTIVVVLLGLTQVVVGNFFEPRMMSRSLSLSPLVILLSLALWGTIWGIVGMFLGVPLTVIFMIILAQFEMTRPVAVLLSNDGNLAHLDMEK